MRKAMNDNAPILQVRGLVRKYGGLTAVDNLSFDIARGSITGLIGPNGSGKTTTIDCISGFQQPDAGSVHLNGESVEGLPPHKLPKRGLVRTFQNTRIYEELTALDHLLLGRQEFDGYSMLHAFIGSRGLRAAEKETAERAEELLSLVHLQRYRDAQARILSYGQRKLLALCMSIIPDPDIVLLDEPLAGVNPALVDEIESAIKRLNKRGHTFLIIEHNVQFIMRTCDHVIVMDLGRLLTQGPPDQVKSDPRVLDVYFGKRDWETVHE
jgi:branched-chain amino acid transport system ATP-binding protein